MYYFEVSIIKSLGSHLNEGPGEETERARPSLYGRSTDRPHSSFPQPHQAASARSINPMMLLVQVMMTIMMLMMILVIITRCERVIYLISDSYRCSNGFTSPRKGDPFRYLMTRFSGDSLSKRTSPTTFVKLKLKHRMNEIPDGKKQREKKADIFMKKF